MQKFVCKICEKEFETGQSLGSHKRLHSRKLINCEICHQKFGFKSIEKHKIRCLEKERLSHKHCEKCGKDFKSYSSRFCSRSCANGHLVKDDQKIKTSFTIQKNNSLSKSFLSKRVDKLCKYCGKITKSIDNKPTKNLCTPHCEEFKKNKSAILSEKLKGKSGGYRERGGRGKGSLYKGVWLDSTWELSLVKRLDELGIPWERDTGKHRLHYFDENGNKRNYFPDFYIPDKNFYIEVKGFWTEKTKFKMNSVLSFNKDVNILILDSLSKIENFIC